MHPALSVIFFTTLSGAGYGLWCLLGALLLSGGPACGATELSACSTAILLPPLLCGFVLVSVGLLASMGHLGQPTRAWRAFSQWRTSWLSREGVASVLTYLPASALVVLALFRPRAPDDTVARALGLLLIVGAVLTVFCTARIYSSLKTIRAWHNAFVAPGYLLLAVYSGALWCWAWVALGHAGNEGVETLVLRIAIVAGALLCAALKLAYWHFIDTVPAESTPESATGLGRFGKVKSFERPHTEDNYLTREMGFVLARKHAPRLRALALLLGFGVPPALLCLGGAMPALEPACAVAALLLGSMGIFVERWLFFAQARHTVMLYYGAERA